MTEQEAIDYLQILNVRLTGMAGHKVNGIDEIFGWNEITAICEAIKALEEVKQYREIGTVEEIKQLKENGAFTGIELAQIAAMQMTLKKYREIGTPEECRAAVEKMQR